MQQTFTPTNFIQQMSEQNQILPAIIFAAVGVLLFIIITYGYKHYLAITRSQASVLALLSVVIALIMVASQSGAWGYQFRQSEHEPRSFLSQGIFVAILPLVLIPFLAKLYFTWIGNRLTDAEKNPGMEGVRAWIRGGNLICAVLISLSAWRLFEYSFWGVLALTLMALLAYPILNMASTSSQPTQPMETKTENLSAERERVLKMLDDGKITAQESAELLSALSLSEKPIQQPKSLPVSPHRKIVMVGLALLLIGFFLPWFKVNFGNEMNRAVDQVQEFVQLNSGMNIQMPSMNMKTGDINVAAGDIAHGLGWWILVLGLVAALLPFFATTLEASMQKKIVLAALGIGSILLIYLLSELIRYVSIGILLVLAGYVLEVIGTLKDRQAIST